MSNERQNESGLLTGSLRTGGLRSGSSLDSAAKFGGAFSSNGPATRSSLDSVAKFGDAFSSNGPKADVARAYEPALSGSLGSEARFDALQELIGIQIAEAQDSMIFSSSGGTKISGFGGMFTVEGAEPARSRGVIEDPLEDSVLSPWQIVFDGDREEYRIVPGKIFYSYADREAEIDIQDVEQGLDVAPGKMVWLELTDMKVEVPTLTLRSGDPWEEHPLTFKEEDTAPFLSEVTTAYFLIWEFTGGALPVRTYGKGFATSAGDPFWGRQALRAADLAIVWGSRNMDTMFRKMSVPVLVPLG